jgi:hypothetical protein
LLASNINKIILRYRRDDSVEGNGENSGSFHISEKSVANRINETIHAPTPDKSSIPEINGILYSMIWDSGSNNFNNQVNF